MYKMLAGTLSTQDTEYMGYLVHEMLSTLSIHGIHHDTEYRGYPVHEMLSAPGH